MIEFVVSVAAVIGTGVGAVALRRWWQGVAGGTRWYWVLMGPLALVLALAFLAGVVLLEIAGDDGDVAGAWLALLLVAPVLCDLYTLARWKVYGEPHAKRTWTEWARWEDRQDRAVALLEGQGFRVERVGDAVYLVEHTIHAVPALRGVKGAAELIDAAERLYPLLLHQEIKGEPTEVVILSMGQGPAWSAN